MLDSLTDFVHERKKAIAIIVLLLVGLSFTSSLFSSSTTIANDISSELTLYDVGDHDGDSSDRLLLSEGDRCYTELKIKVVASSIVGLRKFIAILKDEAKSTVILSADMEQYSTGSNVFTVTLDVDGLATGYYYVVIDGVPTTHDIQVLNPAYVDYQQYIAMYDREPLGPDGDPLREPDQYILETHDDVDILAPSPRKTWIENPWQDIAVSFDVFQTSVRSPVYFNYAITTGSAIGVTLAIYNSQNSKIADSKDPNNFVFNEDGAQADDSYKAILYIAGASGWIGTHEERTFTVDNPSDLEGLVTISILKNGVWEPVSQGGIIKGTVLIEAKILSGIPSKCNLIITGPVNDTISLYESANDTWSVEFDTRDLVNGAYDLSVEAIRAEDGAKVYFYLLSTNLADGVEISEIPGTSDLSIFYVGGSVLVVFYIFYRWRKND